MRRFSKQNKSLSYRVAASPLSSLSLAGSASTCTRTCITADALCGQGALHHRHHHALQQQPNQYQYRHFRIVNLGEDTPEEVAERAAKEAAERRRLEELKRQRGGKLYLPTNDPLLTSFPEGVGTCLVFRNVMTTDEEQRIWEELIMVMKKDGTMHYAEATKMEEKRLRNIYLEMYGMKPYTDIKNWKKQETKQVPGFVWSPTLVKWLQKVGPEMAQWVDKDTRLTPLPQSCSAEAEKAEAAKAKAKPISGAGFGLDSAASSSSSNPLTTPKVIGNKIATPSSLTNANTNANANKTSDGGKAAEEPAKGPVDWLDMARIVEHSDPGYEMHTEHPTTGRYFVYLNLLSDTVLTFDDEATGRVGKVYLPQRSLMICSGELRWGWRVGEHSARTQVYEKRMTNINNNNNNNNNNNTNSDNNNNNSSSSVFMKRVTPDIRLSIQMWKYDVKLADRRYLQSQMESALREAGGGGLLGGDDASTYDGHTNNNNNNNNSGGLLGGDGSNQQKQEGASSSGPFTINPFGNAKNSGGGGGSSATKNAATEVKRGGGGGPLDMTRATTPSLDDASNAIGMGKLGGDFIAPAEKNASQDESKKGGGGGSGAVAIPKNMEDVDRDFNKYKDSFSKITTLMGDMKAREDAGMKVNDEWIKEKMAFPEEGDEYGFDPVNPERTWEQIENKARFYRDRIRSMDYDGTNQVGQPKKKNKKNTDNNATAAPQTTSEGRADAASSALDERSDPATRRAARDTMDAEIIIEGVNEDNNNSNNNKNKSGSSSAAQRQKDLDDDEDGDGFVGGIFEGFGNPNRSPADMRAAMERLLPKDKADRLMNTMPKSFASGMGGGQQGR